MKTWQYILVVILALAVLYVGITAFADCWSTSPAATFLGKMADCSG